MASIPLYDIFTAPFFWGAASDGALRDINVWTAQGVVDARALGAIEEDGDFDASIGIEVACQFAIDVDS